MPKSPTTIVFSFLFEHVDVICKGLAKIDHVLYMVEKTLSKKSTIPHPEPTNGCEQLQYKSKYCVTSNVRLCKAIVYAVSVRHTLKTYSL